MHISHGRGGVMDIGWLEVFREVAQRGSFTAAAQAMGYTQSAISRQVSALEGAAGATLFDRLPTIHPLAHRRVLRLAELAEERWVAGSGRIEDTLISASLRIGFRPRVELVAAEWIARQGLVAAGLGITLIPSLAVAATR